MAKARRDARFGQKTRRKLRLRAQVLLEELHRDLAAEVRMFGYVHSPHPTSCEGAIDHIVADAAPDVAVGPSRFGHGERLRADLLGGGIEQRLHRTDERALVSVPSQERTLRRLRQPSGSRN